MCSWADLHSSEQFMPQHSYRLYPCQARDCCLACNRACVVLLQVKDPDKYHFRPKELMVKICTIYLNVAAADRAGHFAAAVAADKRSYRPEMFAEASLVLRQLGLLGELQVGQQGEVHSC